MLVFSKPIRPRDDLNIDCPVLDCQLDAVLNVTEIRTARTATESDASFDFIRMKFISDQPELGLAFTPGTICQLNPDCEFIPDDEDVDVPALTLSTPPMVNGLTALQTDFYLKGTKMELVSGEFYNIGPDVVFDRRSTPPDVEYFIRIASDGNIVLYDGDGAAAQAIQFRAQYTDFERLIENVNATAINDFEGTATVTFTISEAEQNRLRTTSKRSFNVVRPNLPPWFEDFDVAPVFGHNAATTLFTTVTLVDNNPADKMTVTVFAPGADVILADSLVTSCELDVSTITSGAVLLGSPEEINCALSGLEVIARTIDTVTGALDILISVSDGTNDMVFATASAPVEPVCHTPPRLTSATTANDYDVVITFDMDVIDPPSLLVSKVFAPTTAALFASDARLKRASSNSFVVISLTDSSYVVGSAISVRSVFRVCADGAASPSTTALQAPEHPNDPVIPISGPKTVSLCAGGGDRIVLENYFATGFAGRDAEMMWSVPGYSEFLADQDSSASSIYLLKSDLLTVSGDTLSVLLTATNAFDVQSVEEHVISLRSGGHEGLGFWPVFA